MAEDIENIKCECGYLMPVTNANIDNRCNEEGEEYAEVSIYCIVCKEDYEASQWGHWDNDKQAIEALKEQVEN